MTLTERIQSFSVAFARWPASHPWLVQEQGRAVLYAVFVIGSDYRNRSRLYGAYPPGFLERVYALFPDVADILHAFSGSLPPGPFSRLDLVDRCGVPDLRFHQGSIYDAPEIFTGRQRFDLVIADPPYSSKDAEAYGTPMIDRGRATRALADIVKPGGHLVWLDTCWPMHRKTEWVTVGRILVQRSTNHRARVLSIFERVA